MVPSIECQILMSPDLKKYIQLFLKDGGRTSEGLDLLPLPGDGSRRVFWRFTLPASGDGFIAMSNSPVDDFTMRENQAYVMIGKHLHKKNIPVPEIFQYDLDQGWFIMEDLGQTNLQDLALSGNDPLPVYEKILELLFRLQIEGAGDFDPSWCCQTWQYDHTVMRRYESDYFKEAFLCRYLGLKKEWPQLEASFDHLAETASRADSRFFLHRDFQSRNIMVSNGTIGIIDWQGARLGPLCYDLASLLIDPYTELSPQQRRDLLQSYLLLMRKHNAGWIDSFKRYFPYLAIQRNLQILGAFSYLTKVRKKQYFEAYIPAALKTLRELLLEASDPELSPLRDIVDKLQLPNPDKPDSKI
ncbi:MAG: phosphotransferase [Deltaproteobacteria bacterium]|nr:phosphotransferase [Deltaproteobacteria bacterium]